MSQQHQQSHSTIRTFQVEENPGERPPRTAAHIELIGHLYRVVRAAGHQAATGCSTILGKRPDLASINKAGKLVIWECKTRFQQLERQQAWDKYRAHCHYLMMVYPIGTDLFNWSPAGWITPRPSSRFCGAMLVDAQNYKIERPPVFMTAEPTEILHLTQSILRLHGSTARKYNAVA